MHDAISMAHTGAAKRKIRRMYISSLREVVGAASRQCSNAVGLARVMVGRHIHGFLRGVRGRQLAGDRAYNTGPGV